MRKRIVSVLSLVACTLATVGARAQDQNWHFYNTFWTSMAVGNFWGYSYVCGGTTQDAHQVICGASSHFGGQIPLCGRGHGAQLGYVPIASSDRVAKVAMVSVPGYALIVVTTAGRYFWGQLPSTAPVPDAQGSLDVCDIQWTDLGMVPSGGALDIAYSNSDLSLYTVGVDHRIYVNMNNNWTDTFLPENAEQIGWSPSNGTVFALASSGTPYEGVLISGGPDGPDYFQWTPHPFNLPYCGPQPTLSSPSCILSLGGNALARWEPGSVGNPAIPIMQWESVDDGGFQWVFANVDAFGFNAFVNHPGVVEVQEAVAAPDEAGRSRDFWVSTITARVYGHEHL